MKWINVLVISLILILFCFGCIRQTPSPGLPQDPIFKTCTMEALVCPDGSAVGRSGPNCEFSPCQNCSCPGESFILNGDMCIPKCATGPEPICNLPGKKCTPDSTKSSTTIANPASKNCIDNNGALSIVDTNQGQVGMCTLTNGVVCEEWAYFRGECN